MSGQLGYGITLPDGGNQIELMAIMAALNDRKDEKIETHG